MGLKLWEDIVNSGAAPAWVTKIPMSTTPVALTNTMAVLWVVDMLGEAVMVNAPSPLPPDMFTVAQDWLDETVHDVLLKTLIVRNPAAAERVKPCGDTVSVGAAPAWVTRIPMSITPVALTNTMAVL